MTDKPFQRQSININRHVSARKLRGEVNYFTALELRNKYDEYRGYCSYCGLALVSDGQRLNTAHFIFRIPLEVGGSVHYENILPVCWRCSRERKPKRPPERPIFEFNAFSDLIVQLVTSVVSNDQDRTQFFKIQLEHSFSDFIDSLFYKPVGLPPKEVNRFEGENSISDVVEGLTKEIQMIMAEALAAKEYNAGRMASQD